MYHCYVNLHSVSFCTDFIVLHLIDVRMNIYIEGIEQARGMKINVKRFKEKRGMGEDVWVRKGRRG